jgi:hypothetical protein
MHLFWPNLAWWQWASVGFTHLKCMAKPTYFPIISSEWNCNNETNKLRGLSPQANYTARATAAVGEVVPTFAGRGVLRGQRNGSRRPLFSVF